MYRFLWKQKIQNKNPDASSKEQGDVYTGSFANKCRKYAEQFYPFSWVILSAKYRLLFSDDIVSNPYNVSFSKNNTNPATLRS